MTTIDHTLPTGETLTFTVTLRGCEPGTCAAMVEYPAGVDLSQWSTREAYPMAAIEAAIATATKADAARFTHCDSYGADANTWEEWHFAIDTVTGSTEVDPGSMGDGWADDAEAARGLVEVLETVYARRGWTVDVSVGHRGSRDAEGDRDSDTARAIDAVAEAAFAAYCAESGDEAATLATLESAGEVPVAA